MLATDLWVGHPWASFRFDGTSLCFSQLHESGAELTVELRVDPARLRTAVEEARRELELFAGRLVAAGRRLARLAGLTEPDLSLVANRLAGLAS